MADIDSLQLPDGSQFNLVDNKSDYATKGYVQDQIGTITKTTIGLGNVDNTSDANKPVSTAQQSALNAKLYSDVIADEESEFTASRRYEAGEQFIYQGALYKTTEIVPNGDPFEVGVNVELSDDILTQMSGKQDTLTFDNVPTENSTNPVKSGGVYSAIKDVQDYAEDNISAIVNVYGSKNILPYPYSETTKTENGITFTGNGDGTITFSGTATSSTFFSFCQFDVPIKKGKYIVSGCPEGGSLSSYCSYFRVKINGVTTDYESADDIVVDVPDDGTMAFIIEVLNGTVISTPLTFKPMIRDARITDPTYAPYAMTNRELTDRITAKFSFNGTLDSNDCIVTDVPLNEYIPIQVINPTRSGWIYNFFMYTDISVSYWALKVTDYAGSGATSGTYSGNILAIKM